MSVETARNLQIWLSGALLVGFMIVIFFRQVVWPMQPPSADKQYADKDVFTADALTLTAENEKAATAFAERAEAIYDQRRDSAKRLEDKANTILSFVGSGSGVIALAGSEKIVHVQPTLLLVVASAFLFAVFVCTIFVLVPRAGSIPNARRLSDMSLLTSDAGPAQIAAINGWEFLETARLTAIRVRDKAGWLTYAQIAFAFGIAAIVLNVLVSSGVPEKSDSGSTHLHCKMTNASVDCEIIPDKKGTP